MARAFLKSVGAAEAKLGNEWLTTPWSNLTNRSDLLDRVRFAKNRRPTGVHKGDKLVLYAAGWERFFGIAIVTSPFPYELIEEGEERWPWVLNIVVPLVVPRIELAPHISTINVANTSVRQQSHIRLSDGQFELALKALVGLVA